MCSRSSAWTLEFLRLCYIDAMDHPGIDELISAEAEAALSVPETPAYVYSEAVLRTTASHASSVASSAGCKLLYTLKPCGLAGVLDVLSPYVDGFGTSSIFEARLAGGTASTEQSIHCYSPAFSQGELAEVLATADYVSLNSFRQLDLAESLSRGTASIGLRVNPEMGFAADERYDPCRRHSKLGVPISDFRRLFHSSVHNQMVEGVHIHNNCESEDLGQLEATADRLQGVLGELEHLSWVNLGGGYYLSPEIDAAPLERATRFLAEQFGVTVFIEPGTALVQQAGMLITEVLDVFDSDGKSVAIIDATTSHMPEVFEYGFAPSLSGPELGGKTTTIVAGRSCLAGDVFGEHQFCEPPREGKRVAIMDAGSYTQSRAAPFNGIPIPSSYLMREDGTFELLASLKFADFAARNGMAAFATA